MARFVLARAVTIPAGTAIAAPATADISFPENEVEAIEITIPPGPNGLMGFRILNANTQVIPYGSNDWIIGNDQVKLWPLQRQVTSGSWQVSGYNTGDYDHTIYLNILVSPVSVAAPDQSGDTVAAVADLSGGVAGSSDAIVATVPPPPPQPIIANPPPSLPFIGPPPAAPGQGGM